MFVRVPARRFAILLRVSPYVCLRRSSRLIASIRGSVAGRSGHARQTTLRKEKRLGGFAGNPPGLENREKTARLGVRGVSIRDSCVSFGLSSPARGRLAARARIGDGSTDRRRDKNAARFGKHHTATESNVFPGKSLGPRRWRQCLRFTVRSSMGRAKRSAATISRTGHGLDHSHSPILQCMLRANR